MVKVLEYQKRQQATKEFALISFVNTEKRSAVPDHSNAKVVEYPAFVLSPSPPKTEANLSICVRFIGLLSLRENQGPNPILPLGPWFCVSMSNKGVSHFPSKVKGEGLHSLKTDGQGEGVDKGGGPQVSV